MQAWTCRLALWLGRRRSEPRCNLCFLLASRLGLLARAGCVITWISQLRILWTVCFLGLGGPGSGCLLLLHEDISFMWTLMSHFMLSWQESPQTSHYSLVPATQQPQFPLLWTYSSATFSAPPTIWLAFSSLASSSPPPAPPFQAIQWPISVFVPNPNSWRFCLAQ